MMWPRIVESFTFDSTREVFVRSLPLTLTTDLQTKWKSVQYSKQDWICFRVGECFRWGTPGSCLVSDHSQCQAFDQDYINEIIDYYNRPGADQAYRPVFWPTNGAHWVWVLSCSAVVGVLPRKPASAVARSPFCRSYICMFVPVPWREFVIIDLSSLWTLSKNKFHKIP